MEYKYMLLGRFKMDLDYFWGCGNKCERHLFWGNYKEHIRETIKLWKELPIKPEWFRATELINFKNKLI